MGLAVFVALVVGAILGGLYPWFDAFRPILVAIGRTVMYALAGVVILGVFCLVVWAVPVATASSLAWLLERTVDNKPQDE